MVWMHRRSVDSHIHGKRHARRMGHRVHTVADSVLETCHTQQIEARYRDWRTPYYLIACGRRPLRKHLEHILQGIEDHIRTAGIPDLGSDSSPETTD
jgi:hypothetical protein